MSKTKELKGGNGRFLTEALFYETSRDRNAYSPLFTLKAEEHQGLPSLKQIYLQYRDPTEYTFAMGVLGSWQHWELLCELSWFAPFVEEWRKELAVLLQSEAAAAALGVLSDAGAPAATKMQAARYVAEQGWKPKATKGRPKKEDIEKETKRIAETRATWEDDYQRIMN